MARRDKPAFGGIEGLSFHNTNATAGENHSEYRYIPADKIKPSPFNEGMQMDEEKIEEYTRSMKDNGIMQPVVVYDLNDGNFELLSGHQRFEAWCHRLGNATIPAVVRNMEPDLRKKFAAHTEANTMNRVLDGTYWVSRIEQARKVLAQTGFNGRKDEEMKQLVEMLGIQQAQIYRYDSFAKLIPELQQFESKKWLSARTLSGAGGLDAAQQKMLAEKILALKEKKEPELAEHNDVFEITRNEFNQMVSEIKKGSATTISPKKRLSYVAKIEKAGESFLKLVASSKTDDEKKAALEAIRDMRRKLDEAEAKLM